MADWAPKPDFVLGPKDVDRKQTYLGSKVWKNPRIEIREYDVPAPGIEEVLIEVKACGILVESHTVPRDWECNGTLGRHALNQAHRYIYRVGDALREKRLVLRAEHVRR